MKLSSFDLSQRDSEVQWLYKKKLKLTSRVLVNYLSSQPMHVLVELRLTILLDPTAAGVSLLKSWDLKILKISRKMKIDYLNTFFIFIFDKKNLIGREIILSRKHKKRELMICSEKRKHEIRQ